LDGTAFQIDHYFANGEGTNPAAGLTLANGLLYGSAYYGGATGGGAIFSFNPVTETYHTVHDLVSTAQLPGTPLTLADSTLYGGTQLASPLAMGTIFSYTVPEPSALLLATTAAFAWALWRRQT
jgi:uncharacterized repeat protein (TIGR03803 family)